MPARERADAELAFQKARAGIIARRAGIAAGLGCLALACAFFALMALVLGLVLALTPMFGAWAATGIVLAALLGMAGIAVLLALGQVSRIRALLRSEP